MNTKLLIDAIVRQTTVLIAQLSTAAGIRAPLARIADQVFLDLTREIEAQGVGRKVVADMFGMAIRSYQKKVRRLTNSETEGGTTLWHAVLDHLQGGSTTRDALLRRFARDPEREVSAVLNDLVQSGFVYCTGRGANARYGTTTDSDRAAILDLDQLDSLAHVLWLDVQRTEPTERSLVLARFDKYEAAERALDLLLEDGRVKDAGNGQLVAANFHVPLGSEQGWEAAVLDHFQTVVRAIGAKVRNGKPNSSLRDRIGGSTVSFSVYPGHPNEDEVYRLLQTVRETVMKLFHDVSRYNEAHPVPQDTSRVSFYFGQTLDEQEDETL